MVLGHCEAKCHMKKLIGCRQGHSEGLYQNDIAISAVSFELNCSFAVKPSLLVDHSYVKQSSEHIGLLC